MLRLLTVEYYKLKYNKTSRILIIGYFILLLAIALVTLIEIPIIEVKIAEQGIFNFPYIWHGNTWLAALLKFFLAVVIVSMTANEYSNRTLKQNLIDGLSKKEFILSKFFTIILFSLISTVFIFILSLVLGLIYSDFNEIGIIFSELEFLFGFFLKLVGFFSFCLFLGLLIKRSAFALGFLLFWWIFEWIVLGLLSWAFDSKVGWAVWDILPLGSMWNLINEPITRLNFVQTLSGQIDAEITLNYAVHWYEVLIVSVWIFIFIYASYALLKKRDL